MASNAMIFASLLLVFQAPLEFEVVSVKPSAPGSGMSIGYQPGRFFARNITLGSLIANAFNLRAFQIEGGPGWMNSDRFDIEARLPANTNGRQGGAMLQALLVDRFQLKFHRETRQMPIYALIVGKSGPKMTPARDADGTMIRGTGAGQMEFQKTSMQSLAQNLAGNMDRLVLDRTGLTGEFNFKLEWNPDLTAANADLGRPTIFTAVQEQLGLRLESERGPVEILVIDGAARPPAN